MSNPLLDDRCPASFCGEARACGSSLAGLLPLRGAERTAMLVLRSIAAARETGDACCWDAAFDEAEAVFGDLVAPLVVARAGALLRRLAGTGVKICFLPPPCRRLSGDEAALLTILDARPRAMPSRLDLAAAADAVAAFAASLSGSAGATVRQAA